MANGEGQLGEGDLIKSLFVLYSLKHTPGQVGLSTGQNLFINLPSANSFFNEDSDPPK